MKKTNLNLAGVMSGSSMDGMDVALCQFYQRKRQIHYKILKAETFSYSKQILEILQNIRQTSAKQFFEYDVIYGKFIGQKITNWIKKYNLTVDAISIHGHTVFHEPQKGFSIQLGNAFQIAALCKVPVIHNFRNLDIALLGQGAPLVPMGDKVLFSDVDACVNIGGIANIFIQKTQIAYDICIANMGLNYFAQKLNKQYDKDGNIARKGKINDKLLLELNQLQFIIQKAPKSLNREYFENSYLPIIQKYRMNVEEIIATLTEHIAVQISKSIANKIIRKVLITGGGALNKYLVDRIIYHSKDKKIIIPDRIIVKYKEALIFALLGYLRLLNLPNTISSATGAIQDTVSGEIVYI